MSQENCLDIVNRQGKASVIRVHPIEKVVAYDSGNSLIIWDLGFDKKIKMHYHENDIQQILFFGNHGEYILSIDSGDDAKIIISEWKSLQRITEQDIEKHSDGLIHGKILASFNEKYQTLAVVENYSNQGYRVHLYEFRNPQLNLIFSNKAENINQCLELHLFYKNSMRQFITTEKQCIKWWSIDENQVSLINRVHVNDEISSSIINELSNHLFLICSSGYIMIFTLNGLFMNKLNDNSQIYTSGSVSDDFLFIGCKSGNVQVFSLSTLQLAREINYKQHFDPSYIQTLENQKPLLGLQTYQNDYFLTQRQKSYPQINQQQFIQAEKLSVSENSQLLSIIFENGTLLNYDVNKEKKILFMVGHSQKITSILWIDINQFVTCSNDQKIIFWRNQAERWIPQISDLQKPPIKQFEYCTLDVEFSLNKNFQSSEVKTKKLKCMVINPQNDYLYIGDNQGNIYEFNVKNQLLMRQTKLKTSKNSKIQSMDISQDAQFLFVAFQDGLSICLQIQNNNFKLVSKLEEMFSQSNVKSIKQVACIKFNQSFEIEFNRVQHNNNLSSSRSNLISNKSLIKDETCKVLSVNSQNSIRLHQISKIDSYISDIILQNYYVKGNYVNYKVHPSQDYILVLSSDGHVYLYKINTAELRGKISIPLLSRQMDIDVSGLYMIISSYSSDVKEIAPQNKTQNSLLLYEIGTGQFLGDLTKIIDVRFLKFSQDSSLLAIGGNKGHLEIYAVHQLLLENIQDITEKMAQISDFWKSYPIYLDNYKNEQKITNFSHAKQSTQNKDFLNRLKLCNSGYIEKEKNYLSLNQNSIIHQYLPTSDPYNIDQDIDN